MVELTPAEAEAAELIETVYSRYGKGFLSCSCGDWDVHFDAEAINNYVSIRDVYDLIEHARYDHDTAYFIIFDKKPVIVMKPTRTQHHRPEGA